MHINYSSNGTKSGGALYQGKSSGIIGVFDTFAIGFHDWHPTKAFDVYFSRHEAYWVSGPIAAPLASEAMSCC